MSDSDAAPKATKACRVCGEEIKPSAQKCIHCDSYQNWQRFFGFSGTVLSLLVALVAVSTAAVPMIVSLLSPSNSQLNFSVQREAHGGITDLADDGTLTNRRVFVRTKAPAVLDGPAVDAAGCVWNSLYNGWCINRYSPSGELVEFIRFPCASVTKVAFGGDDLCDVYATTAWMGMSGEARAQQPLAGGLFKFRTNVPGLPQAEIRHGV